MARTLPSGYRIQPLSEQHNRAVFSCGVEELDRYFRMQVGQDVRRRIASCFVLVGPDGTIAGYHTLSATSLLLTDLPLELAKKLPRYPAVSAILMGRLAVERQHRGHGLGELLLLDACARALRSEIASYALVVDAKDGAAQAFYERYGFVPLSSAGTNRRLLLPLAQIAALFT